METITYYRIFGNLEAPEVTTGVFRRRDDGIGLYLERYDRASRSWVDDGPGLAKYLYNGEPGAEMIHEATALRWISNLDKPSKPQAMRLQLLRGDKAFDPKALHDFVEAIKTDGREMDAAQKPSTNERVTEFDGSVAIFEEQERQSNAAAAGQLMTDAERKRFLGDDA
jgi:hypothetical protein